MKNWPPGTVLLIGALSLTTGWALGTTRASRQNPPDAPAAAARPGPRPLGSATPVAPLTRQLRERLDTQPSRTPSAGRNPFVFEARRPNLVRSRVMPESEAAPVAAPMAPEPPLLQFKLSGIASTEKDGVTVITAIVSDNGVMALVTAGDLLSNGYRVVEVSDTGIVIIDAAGVTQTLRLP